MKRKILKVIILFFVMICLMLILAFTYLKTVDIESKEPVKIKPECEVSTREFNGRKVFVLKPNNNVESNFTILYTHGGSYVAKMTNSHWDFLKKVAMDTNSTIIVPDYPLTPKYTYKDVFNMVEPLYKEIIKTVNVDKFIVMGDSAGGGLALALEEKLSQDDIQMPFKTILISPWLDVRLQNPKISEVQKLDKELNFESLKIAGIAYAGEDGIDSYLVNPLIGDVSKLKNITIFTGTYDILNPDVWGLQENAKNVNVEIQVKEYEKAGHIWIINHNSDSDLENQAYNDLIEEINAN